MLLSVEITQGKFGTIVASERPSIDLNSERTCDNRFSGFGWKLALKGRILTYSRLASSYGPEVTNQTLFIGDVDGTIYLKTKRNRATVKFVPGDLSLRLWRRFGIDEIRFADPNRSYPRDFTTQGSVRCRMRCIFCDGLKNGIAGREATTMSGGEQLSLFMDSESVEVNNSSWAIVNALHGVGTLRPRSYLLLYALPPHDLSDKLSQYRWIEKQLLTFMHKHEISSLSAPPRNLT